MSVTRKILDPLYRFLPGRSIYQFLVRAFARNRKVLEVGPGCDPFVREVGVLAGSILVIEPEWAQDMYKEIPVVFFQGYFEDLVDGWDLDLIYGCGVLHHTDLSESLQVIKRNLRHQGVAIFLEPTTFNPFINFFRVLTPGLRNDHEKPFGIKEFNLIETHFDTEVKLFAGKWIALIIMRPKPNSTQESPH